VPASWPSPPRRENRWQKRSDRCVVPACANNTCGNRGWVRFKLPKTANPGQIQSAIDTAGAIGRKILRKPRLGREPSSQPELAKLRCQKVRPEADGALHTRCRTRLYRTEDWPGDPRDRRDYLTSDQSRTGSSHARGCGQDELRDRTSNEHQRSHRPEAFGNRPHSLSDADAEAREVCFPERCRRRSELATRHPGANSSSGR